jgi:putative FmdB family regulatory protein
VDGDEHGGCEATARDLGALMPVYDFVCPSCRRELEVLRKIEDRDEVELCPKCNHVMHREVGAPKALWRMTEKFHPRSP